MSEHERLFLNLTSELESRLNQPTEYDLIRCSGILRQLITESNPLLHLVNRRFQIKILFKTKEWLRPLKPKRGTLTLQTVFPAEGDPTEQVKIDGFMKTGCIAYHEHLYTVRDIIQICAHIKGGIHSGVPESPHESAVTRDKEFLQIKFGVLGSDATDLCLSQIKPIGYVALSGVVQIRNLLSKP